MTFASLSAVALLLAATTVGAAAPAAAAPSVPLPAASTTSLAAPPNSGRKAVTTAGALPAPGASRQTIVFVRNGAGIQQINPDGTRRGVFVQAPGEAAGAKQPDLVFVEGVQGFANPSGTMSWQVVQANGQTFVVQRPRVPQAQQVTVAPPAQVVAAPAQVAAPAPQPAPVVVPAPVVAPVTQPVVPPPPTDGGGGISREIEQLINVERQNNGRSALAGRGDLQANAAGHASAMAARGAIYHQAMGPLLNAWAAQWVSENVASNSVGAGAAGLVRQWMNSPGHRTNLLSERATITGCGVAAVGGQNYASCEYAQA